MTADNETRRDFLYLSAASMGAVAAGSFGWTAVDSMNPAKDTLALASTEVNLAPVEVGQAVTVLWRGKPVFVRHRTDKEIEEARSVDISSLRDPQPDVDRVKESPWIIVVGICTHLGCVPLGQKSSDPRGDYGGWFCPCHGSHYDTSGRIRKGPAPKNLKVPKYAFLTKETVKIG